MVKAGSKGPITKFLSLTLQERSACFYVVMSRSGSWMREQIQSDRRARFGVSEGLADLLITA